MVRFKKGKDLETALVALTSSVARPGPTPPGDLKEVDVKDRACLREAILNAPAEMTEAGARKIVDDALHLCARRETRNQDTDYALLLLTE